MDNNSEKRRRIRGISLPVQAVAISLRRTLTPAEQTLWKALRGKRAYGLGFRRQHPVGRFVLDFYAPSHHLVVELDGGEHAEQAERDAERTAVLQSYGYRVLRFRNEEILNDLPHVVERIYQAALQQEASRDVA